MLSGTEESSAGQIKRIPIKEPTWRELHDLKKAGQSYDDLISEMIEREQDYREWKMIAEIEEKGDFIPFNPEDILGN